MQWAFLALAVVLASVTLVAAQGPPGWAEMGFGTAALFQYPTEEQHLVEMRLAGTASEASTKEAWAVVVQLTGVATRTFTYDDVGQRTAEEAGEVQASITFADPATGAVVDTLALPLQYHATRTEGVAQALDAWAFHFGALEDAAPFWLGATGEAQGLQVQDGKVQHLVSASGQAIARDGAEGHRATQFRLDLAGHASEERLD